MSLIKIYNKVFSARDSDDYRAARWDALGTVKDKNDPMAYLLPVEITRQIFGHCLPYVTPLHSLDNFDDPGLSLANVTGSLIGVNKNWRNIAYSTPELWNKIFVRTSASLLSSKTFCDNIGPSQAQISTISKPPSHYSAPNVSS
ncbi:hypothetical protein CPB83DRAFT_836099 [Crepidotus variabilis]|uniref:F-box domain-containing protein n=1 Tax=Crepidotus variabilis TaxID=179855 RepID=A0A9P6EG89_9AGAR|nr:hypothetical protein CPB83DRAFT_836099 [Crepidotus variabilis]